MTETEALDPLRRRKYARPPVAEAIARAEWVTPATWSITTPGLLYNRLSDEYPAEPHSQGQAVLQANISTDEPNVGGSLQVVGGGNKLIFGQPERTRLISVSPRDISAHSLAPYEGWESLETRLFDAIHKTADLSPEPSFSTLGLRYVNHVDLPAGPLDFSDYLTIGISLPEGFPTQVTAFFDRTETRYPDDSTTIALTWASTEAPEGSVRFVLDLDLYFKSDNPMDVHEARERLGELKAKEGRAFEALLQDRLRGVFGELGD